MFGGVLILNFHHTISLSNVSFRFSPQPNTSDEDRKGPVRRETQDSEPNSERILPANDTRAWTAPSRQMSMTYVENPLLFVTSTDRSTPNGRNIRAQSRSHDAAPAKKLRGEFGVLNIYDLGSSLKSLDKERHARGRRKTTKDANVAASENTHLVNKIRQHRYPSPTPALHSSYTSLGINPSQVLAIASFHIRRIAAITVRTDPSRLLDVLRCRQWSCVSSTFDGPGETVFLDNAIVCVAAKLRHITFSNISPISVFLSYEKALHSLRNALKDRSSHCKADLLTAMQLLAIYEMLDFPTNDAWIRHLEGAHSFVQLQPSNAALETEKLAQTFAQAAPMYTDALLADDEDFFLRTSWRNPIHAIVEQQSPATHSETLTACFSDLPGLLADAHNAIRFPGRSTMSGRFDLLSAAQDMRHRIRKAVVESKLYQLGSQVKTESASFDVLGLSLAGLIALDRMITSLQPSGGESVGASEELCTHLLNLELDGPNGYPARDLITAFQRQSSI